MTRKMVDCRITPSESGCTLTISGEADEVVPVAVQHAITTHGHADSAELRAEVESSLEDDTVSRPGAFVQLIEFDTDQPDECDAIASRWADAIGSDRTTRWSLIGADRDRPGHYVAMVEFPDYEQAMKNSAHPATDKFMSEMMAICSTTPQFRNLDIRSARAL
jgi:hypothetical protein